MLQKTFFIINKFNLIGLYAADSFSTCFCRQLKQQILEFLDFK